MPEQITITVSLEQAEALVAASNCATLAAEGNMGDVIKCFMPAGTSIAHESDRLIVGKAELAQEVAVQLHREIDDAYKRDPNLQDFLHRLKMYRKHCRDE